MASLEIKDILAQDGVIKKIEDGIEIPQNIRVVDAKKNFLLAGFVDLNVRLANSQLNSDSLKKLTKTSLLRGVTTSVIMPDFSPRVDSSALLDHFMIKADKEEASLQVCAPLVNENGDKLNSIAIFCSCYDENLDDSGVMNEGELSFKLGLSGISKISESSEVAKIAEISTINNTKIIFQSLSSKRSIDIIKDTKKVNKNFFAEVSIHHLCKNENSCDGFNTYAKILPPLRDESERVKLMSELALGNIDVLRSAHSPKSVGFKDVAFEDAEFGIGSIEEYLSLCYTHLVKSEIITMQRLEELCSTNPANLINEENIGKIEVGYKADMVLFDEKSSQIVNNKSSLYNGDELFGKVVKVFKDGHTITL